MRPRRVGHGRYEHLIRVLTWPTATVEGRWRVKGQSVAPSRGRVGRAALRLDLFQLVERPLLPAVLHLDHGVGKTRL